MKKLKNNTKTMLALIAKDQATRLRKRLDQGLAVDQQIKVPGRYKPMTLLEYASEKGAIRCAQLLVNSAAKLDKGYFKPLDLATLFGRLRIIKLLLASGANPSVRFSDPPHDSGLTPLMTAAATGNRAIFDALLTSGADPHATTARGASALSQAVAHRNQRAIERLVRAGCRASGQELHTPVYHGDVETVRLLIRAGADVNVETRGRY